MHEQTATSISSSTFCVWAGACFGVLAASLLVPIDMAGRPLWTIALSCVFGGAVGLFSIPFVLAALYRRDPRGSHLPIVAMTAPVVCLLSMLLPPFWFPVIMAASGLGFVIAAFVVSRSLPRLLSVAGGCQRCGYDLRGSVEAARCPECGAPFDRDTFRIDETRLAASTATARHSGKNKLLWLLVIVPVLIGLGRTIIALPYTSSGEFDSARWRAGDDGVRIRMADDLQKSGILLGLPEKQVLAELGPPDGRADVMYYDAGRSKALSVLLDKKEKVSRVDGYTLRRLTIEPFDAERWRRTDKADRGGMACDLLSINSGILDGKTVAEVIELLGPPDDRTLSFDYSFSPLSRRSDSLLSMEMIFGLTVELKDGRVTNVWLSS